MMASYLSLLLTLEQSWLGHVARHSSWLFLVANVLHVLGAALLVGSIAVFDIAVLTRHFEEAAKVGPVAIPVAATGLALQIPTGLVLLAAEATKLGVNPAFYAKLVLIALGLINVAAFHLRYGWAARAYALGSEARASASLSMGAWVLALVAGRVIAYL
jgi:hypothetical protein